MKSILLKIILLFTILNANNIIISPLFYSSYRSLGGTLSTKNDRILLTGMGFVAKFESKNFNIDLDFYNNRFYGINQKPNEFSNEQGLSWWKTVDEQSNKKGDKFDFDVANIKIYYVNNNSELFLGKFNRHWGNGKSSLSISNKSPSFPQFGFNWNINSKLKFEYFHGSLRSLIIDSLNIDYYQGIGARSPNLNRFIVGHRIDIKIFKKLSIGVSEMVIYGIRNLDMMYNIPFVPFWSLQHYLGDLDNLQFNFDFIYHINENIDFYGSLLIDEWRPSLTFTDSERNWFAYQVGIKSKNILFNNDFTLIEYTWTDHRIYKHRFPINDFYNHGYPIGFWGGPHSEEFYINYNFNKFNLSFEIDYSTSKRGELSEEMLNNQYFNNQDDFERYTTNYESIEIFELLVSKNIYKGLNFYVGFSIINWKNGGFDPFDNSIIDLIDTNKNSYNLGFSYNFNIKKQAPFINEQSIRYKI